MATIKSYTDIEQSKKLAEILPLKSADMEYLTIKEDGTLVGAVPFVKDDSEIEDSAYSYTYDRISCWSLAALLELMPIAIRNYQLTIETEGDVYNISYDDILSGEILILYADCCLFEAIFKMVVWLTKQGHIKVNDY